MCIRGITTITLLKSRISQEDVFRGSRQKLALARSENMNKTTTFRYGGGENRGVGPRVQIEEVDHVTQDSIQLIK